jgi:hypothetical protein
MSGFEAVGVVLAVLPLLISTLEHYNEGLEPVKTFFQWRKELPVFVRALRTQRVHLEQNLKVLLSPIASQDEVAALMNNPIGEMWKGDMAERLQERLGEAYHEYYSTVIDCEETLKTLVVGLDIDKSGNVRAPFQPDSVSISYHYTDKSTLKASQEDFTSLLQKSSSPSKHGSDPVDAPRFEFRKRVKFTMSKKRMKLLIDKLDICNKTLMRFGMMSEKLAPYRTTWKARFTCPLHKVRNHASNLHRALTHTWNCHCSCQSPHIARLQLEPRMVEVHGGYKKQQSKTEVVQFKILVSVKGQNRNNPGGSHQHSWQETQVLIIEREGEVSEKENENPMSSPRAPKVMIVVPEMSSGNLHTTTTIPKNLFRIDDFCRIIHQSLHGKQTLCLCLDTKGDLHGTFATKMPQSPKLADTITLEELLSSSTGSRSARKTLTRRDRHQLAVNLASSLLQLHSTPWLDMFWSKKDISFLLTDPQTIAIDSAQPYVSQTFLSQANTSDQHMTKTRTKEFHANPSILALGILLLELYFGETLETAREVENSVFDYETNGTMLLCEALGWVDSVTDDISFKYLQAAQHCIKCFFETRSKSLMDEEFRQAVCEKVLVPLQEELALFMEGPR